MVSPAELVSCAASPETGHDGTACLSIRIRRKSGRVGGGDVREPTLADDLISIPEAARRVGLHTDTLYRLCRTGQFPPALQIGARWRVSVPRLERYLHGDGTETLESEPHG